ncbi:MAG TPA: GspE/PulE family protein [Rhodoblastus sp.]|nr:GspE/PulE family protein [Rhodoblastus sp.]
MAADPVDDFARELSERYRLHFDAALDRSRIGADESRLRRVWETSFLNSHDFADEVAAFARLDRIAYAQMKLAEPLVAKFSRRFLRQTFAYPFADAEGRMWLAVADPWDPATVRAAELALGGPVALVVAAYDDVALVLREALEDEQAEATEAAVAARPDDVENLRDLASGAPVVRAVNDLIEKAIDMRASDIHVEPFRNGLVVRMRIDGLLRVVPAPTLIVPEAIISRIKILASLDIAERRLPQDGAARVRIGAADIDMRVATMPRQHGEAAVIRLLPRDRGLLDIKKLGLSPADERKLTRVLELPHGLVAVTGPTGSGKTTSLATMLSILNDPSRKILTIEDPVEYEIEFVNQSQVKPSIGLTFAAAMRSFVRQDPDVIMVGEIRDRETADISIHAALTGHLVLTTLHTETASAAVPRLVDLGVEPFLLRSTLRAVIAQRLVRILCDRCKAPEVLDAETCANDRRYGALGLRVGDRVWRPVGCERCNGAGYRGRVGIFEVLEMTDEIHELIGDRADAREIDRAARKSGMTTMIEDAVVKCLAGVTSPAEALRVTTVR